MSDGVQHELTIVSQSVPFSLAILTVTEFSQIFNLGNARTGISQYLVSGETLSLGIGISLGRENIVVPTTPSGFTGSAVLQIHRCSGIFPAKKRMISLSDMHRCVVLDIYSLSGCQLTEDGCASLASALRSNPSHLRELDLSYNHPGDSGVMLLSAGLEDPHWKLDTLRYERCWVDSLLSITKRFRWFFFTLIHPSLFQIGPQWRPVVETRFEEA